MGHISEGVWTVRFCIGFVARPLNGFVIEWVRGAT